MKIKVRDHIEDLKRNKDKWKSLLRDYLEDEVELWEFESAYLNLGMDRWEIECATLAKNILDELKKTPKPKHPRIVCRSTNGEYSWMGTWFSLKSSYNRVCQSKPVIEIISNALLEYSVVSGGEYDLVFHRCSLEEAEKILDREIGEDVCCINVKSSFFGEFDNREIAS